MAAKSAMSPTPEQRNEPREKKQCRTRFRNHNVDEIRCIRRKRATAFDSYRGAGVYTPGALSAAKVQFVRAWSKAVDHQPIAGRLSWKSISPRRDSEGLE